MSRSKSQKPASHVMHRAPDSMLEDNIDSPAVLENEDKVLARFKKRKFSGKPQTSKSKTMRRNIFSGTQQLMASRVSSQDGQMFAQALEGMLGSPMSKQSKRPMTHVFSEKSTNARSRDPPVDILSQIHSLSRIKKTLVQQGHLTNEIDLTSLM